MRSAVALAAVPLALLLAGCPSEKCPSGQTDCTGACIDLQTNPIACGACNHVCPAGSACVGGQCQCPAGEVTCGTACVDLQTDPLHCGSCDVGCGLGTCSAGTCSCNPGATKCTGTGVACVDTTSDPANCGACRTACPLANEACVSSVCQCPASLPDACPTASPTACVNLQSDPRNCQTCGHVCELTNDVCVSGVCQCPAGLPNQCPPLCVNDQTDPQNCGALCLHCPTGAACNAGSCQCPAGLPDVCAQTCVDRQTDPLNCGICGRTCGSGVACASGVCCSGSPSKVCGSPGQCCAGTDCCTAGGPCQTVHQNGLGQNYYDCGALNEHTLAQAQLAAKAWNPLAVQSGGTMSSCGDPLCLCAYTSSQAAIWCAKGSSGNKEGLVVLTTTTGNCFIATCPTGTGNPWN